MDDDFKITLIPLGCQKAEHRGLNPVAIQHNRLCQLPELFLRKAADLDKISFFHLMLRVHQAICKCTVIGKQQQPFGIHVQPPHGIHPLAAVRHQLCRRLSALFIGERSYIPPGLIQH